MQRKLMKNLLLVLTLVVLCLAVGVTASAETWGDYVYEVLENDTVEITEYIGDDTEIIIPSEIDGMMVTKLGDFSFAYNETIINVFVPSVVEYISDQAFYYCFALERIDVSTDNKYYLNDEYGVLFNKDKTKIIQFPSRCKVNEYVMPETVREMTPESFFFTSGLTKIILPEGFASCNESFYMPISLKEITIPSTFGDMDYSFNQALSLTKVTFSDGVKKIGIGVFEQAPCLEEIYIEGMDTEISDFAKTIIYVENEKREMWLKSIEDSFVNGELSLMEAMGRFEPLLEIIPTYVDEPIMIATIYCHSGSTAEAYAIENGCDYVLTHFFEDEWTYDYDNMIRYRKCIHCDELETEALEITGDSDVEIIEPVNPDTDFTVDVITDYVIIEEALSNGVAGDFEIIKAFDINLKNKDGVHVQPDGKVKVKLPLDWSKEGAYKVYRVNDDGTLTDMNAYREGSHLVFDTDHFSVYVIVDESEKSDAPTTPDEPQEETKDNFFTKIFDFIKTIIDLLFGWINK